MPEIYVVAYVAIRLSGPDALGMLLAAHVGVIRLLTGLRGYKTMHYLKTLLHSVIGASVVLGAATLGTGSASAAAPGANFTPMYSLGDNCIGQLQSGISATGGSARFGYSWVKATPTFGGPCSVTVFVNWRNLDTGASGSVPARATDGSNWNQAPGTSFVNVPTGRGRIAVSVTTDRPNLPVAPAEIQVS